MLPKVHISLNVDDLESSMRFYEALFGAPAHKRRPGYANFDLDEPPLKLALEERKAPVASSTSHALNHLGVLVETSHQVDAAKQRLIKAGLATFDEHDVACCYARQDKVWATDPDGNLWEIYALLGDDEARDDDREMDSAARRASAFKLPMAGSSCCG